MEAGGYGRLGDMEDWGVEYSPKCESVHVTICEETPAYPGTPPQVLSKVPLISGLRIAQLATGAHYKIRGILNTLNLSVCDFLCGGDGSGGMTAALLRFYPASRGIFNSLVDFKGCSMEGVHPSPPAAASSMPDSARDRCVNLTSCWEHPSDLTELATWSYLYHVKRDNRLQISLGVFDMEVQSESVQKIESHLKDWSDSLFSENCTIIYKSFLYRLMRQNGPLEVLGPLFDSVDCYVTDLTGSHSSELYLVFRNRRKRHIRCRYPFEGDLKAICALSKSTKSISDEFLRATMIDPRVLICGVPEVLLPGFEVSLRTLLSQVGVPDGLSHDLVWTMKIPAQADNPIVCILSFLIMVSNACIPTTRLAQFDRLQFDRTLQSLANFYYGTWLYISWRLYISWLTLNQTLYKRLIRWASRPITFTYHMREVTQGRHIEWDWSSYRSHKKLDKLEKPDLAARVIRVFAGKFPLTRHADITDQNILNINKITIYMI